MLQIENKIFLKDESAAEVGTTRASINRSGKTNAKKGADDYNAYKEFHEREIEGHVIAAFMVHSLTKTTYMLHIAPTYICDIYVTYM